MPIYEYICSNCEAKFELLRQLSEASEGAPCPCCNGQAERILSRFAAVSKDESGTTTPISSPCSGCSATTCGSCSV